MTTATTRKQPTESELRRSKPFSPLHLFPWRKVLWAALPLALACFYMTRVAPDLVPVPPGVKVIYPELTDALEDAAIWSGQHPLAVWGIAAGILLGGMIFPLSAPRYYLAVAVLTTCALGATWYSLSAPVDRLLRAVEQNLPKDHRVPGAR